MGPPCFFGHPEDPRGLVFVRIFRISPLFPLRVKLSVLRLKRIRDVFQKDQAQDDVFVLCRVHVVAESIGHLPQLGLEAEIRASIGFGFSLLLFRHRGRYSLV